MLPCIVIICHVHHETISEIFAHFLLSAMKVWNLCHYIQVIAYSKLLNSDVLVSSNVLVRT
jgi:hypothetical protein